MQQAFTHIIGPPLPRPRPMSLLFQFLSSCFLKSLSNKQRNKHEQTNKVENDLTLGGLQQSRENKGPFQTVVVTNKWSVLQCSFGGNLTLDDLALPVLRN